MPKRGRKRKKSRTHVTPPENGGESGGVAAASSTTSDNYHIKIPKSLIVASGKSCAVPEIHQLVRDLRHLAMPYTAFKFQENQQLKLQQYVQHLALPMGITHIWMISQSNRQPHGSDAISTDGPSRLNLKIVRLPEGPTLTFRIHEFSLAKHVQNIQKQRHRIGLESLFGNSHKQIGPALVVTNNFGDHTAPPHVKLMRITFQNLFPSINVATVKLSECKRVVLFHLVQPQPVETEEGEKSDNATAPQPQQLVEVRQYAVRSKPVGIHRRVRRLIQTNSKKIPNLSQCQDVSEYITSTILSDASAATSDDSEMENFTDTEESESKGNPLVVDLPLGGKSSGKRRSNHNVMAKSALKLVEVGPRLTIELLKVEKGIPDGNQSSPTLYHAYVTKTPQQIAEQQATVDARHRAKMERKRIQEENVERKKRQKLEQQQERERNRQLLRRDAATAAATTTTSSSHDPNPHGQTFERIEGVSSSSSSSEDEQDEE